MKPVSSEEENFPRSVETEDVEVFHQPNRPGVPTENKFGRRPNPEDVQRIEQYGAQSEPVSQINIPNSNSSWNIYSE